MVKCKQYVSKHIFKNTHGNANAHSKLMTLLPWVPLVPFKYQMQRNYSYRSSYTIHFQSAFFWLFFFKMDTNLFFSVLLIKFQQFLYENLPDFSIGSNM